MILTVKLGVFEGVMHGFGNCQFHPLSKEDQFTLRYAVPNPKMAANHLQVIIFCWNLGQFVCVVLLQILIVTDDFSWIGTKLQFN